MSVAGQHPFCETCPGISSLPGHCSWVLASAFFGGLGFVFPAWLVCFHVAMVLDGPCRLFSEAITRDGALPILAYPSLGCICTFWLGSFLFLRIFNYELPSPCDLGCVKPFRWGLANAYFQGANPLGYVSDCRTGGPSLALSFCTTLRVSPNRYADVFATSSPSLPQFEVQLSA